MKIAVIGAGISGLTCAYELKKAGHEVKVYEKDDHVGGRMSTRVKDSFYFDTGADHLCDLYDEMKEYCAELNIEWEKMRHLRYGVFRNGELVDVKKLMSMWSRIKMGMQYFLLPKGMQFLDLNTAVAYDQQNAYEYIHQKCGQEVADYLVDAFTSAYQFHRAEEISMGALYAIMYSMKIQYGDWYLQRTKGGMSALPEAMAKGLEVKLSTAVTGVEADSQGQLVVSTEQGQEVFEKVVMACTANVTESILKNPTFLQQTLLSQVKYSSTISVAFKIDQSLLPDFSVCWIPYKESQQIASYANETMKGEQLIHNGQSLVSVWLHESFAQNLMKKTDEEIYVEVAKYLLPVAPWLSSIDQLSAHDLQRWPQAEPKFYQGYLTQVHEFLEKGQGEGGLYFCGDYLNAPWTEGALRMGKRLAGVMSQGD